MGYTGGTTQDPTYQSMGDHSEAIQIDFDPSRLSYTDLLRVFWSSHNPCAQPWSVQYRSAIFPHGDRQEELARSTQLEEEIKRGRPIKTEIVPAARFYRAEDYHQKWQLRRNKAILDEYQKLFPQLKDFVDSTAVTRVNGYLAGHGSSDQLEKELPKLGLSERAKDKLRAR